MESKWSIIALLGILMSIAALAAAQPTPFMISGWVNYADGSPVNDPSVTVTNPSTGEVFIAGANASSNYYQIQTSSDNVSAGDVLHFVVSKGSNSTVFDRIVFATDMSAGGFERNATIGPLTPFLISGRVNDTGGNPVNDPSVTVTNQYTGEVFTGTTAGSDYYQIWTSSANVSAGDVLHFVVSKGSNSDEFNHTVSATEVGAGGFERNATIGSGSAVICGDVTGDGAVNMGDVTKLLWNQTYWGYYPVDPCAADVTGEGVVNMGDVTKLLWNQTYWGSYPLTCPC